MTLNTLPAKTESAWPHRWAVALVCATFPLIWLGGLVTTYDAGMAVPDWPNTYGYNLFLYPWQTWIYGPWGLFIEHGHRLLGATVGMLTIGFLASTWYCQRGTLLRVLGFLALAGVLLQGGLGGLRVIENKVRLAQIHGCVGPAFIAFAVFSAVVTSRRWQELRGSQPTGMAKVQRLAIITTLLAYFQLMLGSQLRHLPAGGAPGEFRLALYFHLATALALFVHVGLLVVEIARRHRGQTWLTRPATALSLLILLEITLGVSTWVSKYGWPSWLGNFEFAAGYVVPGVGAHAAWVTTAHVAMGSMLLVNSLLIAVRSLRLGWHGPASVEPRGMMMEAAR